MIASLLRYRCPFCSEPIVHLATTGPCPCPRCLRMVRLEDVTGSVVPVWVWGVVAALAACLLL